MDMLVVLRLQVVPKYPLLIVDKIEFTGDILTGTVTK